MSPAKSDRNKKTQIQTFRRGPRDAECGGRQTEGRGQEAETGVGAGWGMARKGAEESPAVRGVWSEPDSLFLPRRWTAMEQCALIRVVGAAPRFSPPCRHSLSRYLSTSRSGSLSPVSWDSLFRVSS